MKIRKPAPELKIRNQTNQKKRKTPEHPCVDAPFFKTESVTAPKRSYLMLPKSDKISKINT